jgi:hypothetical protein
VRDGKTQRSGILCELRAETFISESKRRRDFPLQKSLFADRNRVAAYCGNQSGTANEAFVFEQEDGGLFFYPSAALQGSGAACSIQKQRTAVVRQAVLGRTQDGA